MTERKQPPDIALSELDITILDILRNYDDAYLPPKDIYAELSGIPVYGAYAYSTVYNHLRRLFLNGWLENGGLRGQYAIKREYAWAVQVLLDGPPIGYVPKRD